MKTKVNPTRDEKDNKSTSKEVINKLVSQLIVNHLRHSLQQDEIQKDKTIRSLLKKDHSRVLENTTRTIFLIGAGASTNASLNVFPPGQRAINLIEGYFEKIDWPTGIKAKAEKVEVLANLPNLQRPTDFETRLFSLSHFFKSNDVQKAISKIYDHKTFPNLFYEMLAHLLKNRFIDGIVNFNFDELLDQAIYEEVGMGQLHKILSDGDCIDYTDMLVNNKLKVPFYIKPHGTVSHKSSLLFTKEHYINISIEIETLLEEILTGQPSDGGKIPNQFKQLNLVIAGFHMESIEFNKLLQRSIEKLTKRGIVVNIIYLSYSGAKDDLQSAREHLEKLFGEKEDLVNVVKLKDFKVSRLRSTGLESYLEGRYLDHFGFNLIDQIRRKFKKPYRPADISRHIGLVSFFQDKIKEVNLSYHYKDFIKPKPKTEDSFSIRKSEMFFESKQYYLERTVFEIINVVLKNNGVIQPKESLKKINRIGIYYDLYLKKHRKEFSDKRLRLSRERIKVELSFYDILEALCLESSLRGMSKEVFEIDKIKKAKKLKFSSAITTWIEKVEKTLASNKYKKHKHLSDLKKICLESLWKFKFCYENIFQYTRGNGKETKGTDAGDSLMQSESINLYPDYNDVQLNIISKLDSSNIISTNLSLKYKYRSMFFDEKCKWEKLHIVSDTALATLSVLKDVVRENIKYVHKKRIYIVLSDARFVKELKDCEKNIPNLSIAIYRLPYYDHSRHMALFTATNLKNVKGIYYYKKGYSNNINAVYLKGITNRMNIDMLFYNFKQYLAKAVFFAMANKEHKKINSVPYFKKNKELERILESAPSEFLTTADKKHFKKYSATESRP